MKKETIKKGYTAFSPDGKMLCNKWVGGAQTGTNHQTLTADVTRALILPTLEEIRMYILWYNHNHKNQVTFTVKEVTLKTTIELNFN